MKVVHDFCKNVQALHLINTVCKNFHRGNCRGSKHTTDWEAESKPLPKRRKCRVNKENATPKPIPANDVFYKSEYPVGSSHPTKSDHPDKNREMNDYPAINDHWNTLETVRTRVTTL